MIEVLSMLPDAERPVMDSSLAFGFLSNRFGTNEIEITVRLKFLKAKSGVASVQKIQVAALALTTSRGGNVIMPATSVHLLHPSDDVVVAASSAEGHRTFMVAAIIGLSFAILG